MGKPARLLSIFVAVVLLAFGATACGGDDSEPPSEVSTEATAPDRPQGESSGVTAPEREAEGAAGAGGGDKEDAAGSEGSEFVPKEHDDSGGGSDQFRIEGGDNSVQEFGEEAGDSEREQAATALHNFLDARAAEDWESACSFLSREIRASLEGLGAGKVEDASCGGIMSKLTNRAALSALRSEAARADVGSLRVEGGRAFIIYRGLEGTILTFPMVNEDGSWKVASIAGTPLN